MKCSKCGSEKKMTCPYCGMEMMLYRDRDSQQFYLRCVDCFSRTSHGTDMTPKRALASHAKLMKKLNGIKGKSEMQFTEEQCAEYKTKIKQDLMAIHTEDPTLFASDCVEECTHNAGHDEWLDDENHWIWDLAIDVFEETEV